MTPDEPLPDYTAWERDERSRLVGYIFGLLDAAASDRLRLYGLEDGIGFQSPWSGAYWKLRLELEQNSDDNDTPPPGWKDTSLSDKLV